jgi:ribose/xylose/arabinose/galactoside ABC-type transport system permease subunit
MSPPTGTTIISARRQLAAHRELTRELAIPLVLIALIGIFGALNTRFLSTTNLLTIVNDASVVGTLALGMTFVLILAGIDLSVGGVVTLTTVVLGTTLVELALPMAVGLLLAVAAGGLVGLLNGIIVVKGRVPAIIATLGMLSILQGATFLITQGATTSLRKFHLLTFIGQGRVGSIPMPAVILIALAVACHILLTRTAIGTRLRATGSNPTAARLMGLGVERHVISIYALSGLLASIGGLIVAGRLSVASATAGNQLELSAITAAALGGTSLSGGQGTIVGTLAGALILSVLLNGLILLGVPFFYQLVATGTVLVVAVAVNESLRRAVG